MDTRIVRGIAFYQHTFLVYISVDTKIFDVQELGGAIEEGDENDLFMADAKPNNTPTQEQMVEEEDNTDLFQLVFSFIAHL